MRTLNCTVLFLTALLVGTGCVYQEQIACIVPPDASVAFVKTTGKAEQAKVETEDEDTEIVKIHSKRVIIPTETRDLGRGPANHDYQPVVRPVMTTRRPVERNWTKWKYKGTSTKNEAFHFESRDSINFSVGGVIISRIKSTDTERFRYSYSGRPLSTIVDENVKSFLQSYMAGCFGKLDLKSDDLETEPGDCLNQVVAIFDDAFKEAQIEFGEGDGTLERPGYGITIDYFSNIGGIHPDNPKTQERLDKNFIQMMNVQVQREKNREQDIRNEMLVMTAEAEREAAESRYEAEQATQLRELFSALLSEQRAINEAAMKWGGVRREGNEFTGGGKGRLPTDLMPADASPLAWLCSDDLQSVLAQMPSELDPALVSKAQERLKEIAQEREVVEPVDPPAPKPADTPKDAGAKTKAEE